MECRAQRLRPAQRFVPTTTAMMTGSELIPDKEGSCCCTESTRSQLRLDSHQMPKQPTPTTRMTLQKTSTVAMLPTPQSLQDPAHLTQTKLVLPWPALAWSGDPPRPGGQDLHERFPSLARVFSGRPGCQTSRISTAHTSCWCPHAGKKENV